MRIEFVTSCTNTMLKTSYTMSWARIARFSENLFAKNHWLVLCKKIVSLSIQIYVNCCIDCFITLSCRVLFTHLSWWVNLLLLLADMLHDFWASFKIEWICLDASLHLYEALSVQPSFVSLFVWLVRNTVTNYVKMDLYGFYNFARPHLECEHQNCSVHPKDYIGSRQSRFRFEIGSRILAKVLS